MNARSLHALRHSLCALSLSTLLFAASAAHAQIQTDGSGNVYYLGGSYTIDSAHSVSSNARVGMDKTYSQTDGMGNPYNATVNLVNGGSVGNNLVSYNSSIVNINGGSVGSDITVWDNSTLNLTGGNVGVRINANGGTTNIRGGKIGDIGIGPGAFNGIVARYNPVINFYGTDLGVTLIDPYFYGSYDLYSLSGKLSDGTDITGEDLFVWHFNTNPTINFINTAAVPEPGNVALLVGMSLSTAGIMARRRRKQAA